MRCDPPLINLVLPLSPFPTFARGNGFQRHVVQRAAPLGGRQPRASLGNFRVLQAWRGNASRDGDVVGLHISGTYLPFA